MSHLLTAYANMCEAILRDPKRFGRTKLPPEEVDRLQRVISLIRSLTPTEGAALLRSGQLPERLPEVAESVGLPVENCRSILGAIVWKLTEGPRWSSPGKASDK
jgi:hypothetical protein